MQIANIYPVANQELYREERYVMILAHLLKKGLYKPENFNEKQYIIMDNGLFEGEQVSTNLQDLIDLVEKSNIPVKEIIVPDVVNDEVATKKLFRENLNTIRKYNHKYTFMFVAQALTYSELSSNILFINQFKEEGLELSVGISKLSPLKRDDVKARTCYKHCKYPIHILGIKDSFDEIEKLTKIENIRGCDTSQLAFIAKNGDGRVPLFIWNYSRKAVKLLIEGAKDIQLEHDVCDMDTLKDLREDFYAEAELYGILR